VAPHSNLALPVLGTSKTQSLADLRGKVVVLNVFASWCDPCKTEAPVLEQEQRKLARQNATILGVTYLDNSSDSEAFVRHEHISYPVVRDVSGSFVRSFGTTGVPETFVINRQGKIAALRRFQVDSKWLDQTLPSILKQAS
jgi:cytochrome c biogenesis protein CcmG, thiol:disulfide interchange protein DsbE